MFKIMNYLHHFMKNKWFAINNELKHLSYIPLLWDMRLPRREFEHFNTTNEGEETLAITSSPCQITFMWLSRDKYLDHCYLTNVNSGQNVVLKKQKHELMLE